MSGLPHAQPGSYLPSNFNNREETSARLKNALPLEVRTLGYIFQMEEWKYQPMAVVKTQIISKAGHRIPEG